MKKWASEVTVPTELDATRFDKHFRPQTEKDERFALVFKLIPKRLRRQYERFIGARSAYIESCQRLYEQVEQECAQRTRLCPVRWGVGIKDWPERVLLPFFALSIYDQVWNTIRGQAVPLQDVSYDIKSGSISQKGYRRDGLYLFVTVQEPYYTRELAQADDKSLLESAQSVHREMMGVQYMEKFTVDINKVKNLRENAEGLATDFRKGLNRLEVS